MKLRVVFPLKFKAKKDAWDNGKTSVVLLEYMTNVKSAAIRSRVLFANLKHATAKELALALNKAKSQSIYQSVFTRMAEL